MKLKLCTALLTAAAIFTPLSLSAEKSQDPTAAKRAAVQVYGKLPLSFEPTESAARFLAHSGGYSVSVGVRESSVAVTDAKSGKTQTLRFAFDHANLAAPLNAIEPQPGVTNYYLGQDSSKWRLGVKNYAKVRAQGVYPGVDVIYYGDHRRLEFDFVVAPKADPRAIALSFSGMEKLSKDASGDLVAEVNGTPIHFVKPYAYQRVAGVSKPVAVDYELASAGSVHLRIGAYDSNSELIIDPVVTYATYLGGRGIDLANGIAVDASGSVYVTGQTASSDFPNSPNPNNYSFSGGSDAYVTKFSEVSSGSPATITSTPYVYTTIIGGSDPALGFALGSGIALGLDSSNQPFANVVGSTSYKDLPGILNAYQGGDSDAFIAILAFDGTLVRTTYLGGSSADLGYGIAVDTAKVGNVSVNSVTAVGQTCSSDFPAYGAIQTKVEACVAFITKLDTGLHIGFKIDPTASAISPSPVSVVAGTTYYFSGFFGGQPVPPYTTALWAVSQPFALSAVVLDSNDPPSIQIAVNVGPNPSGIGTSGKFVPGWKSTKLGLTTDGAITWENLGPPAIPVAAFTEGYGVALDPPGDVFVVGGTNTGSLSPFSTYVGSGAWILKLNGQAGSFVYGTVLETSKTDLTSKVDTARAVAVDTNGFAYVAGTATGTLFTTPNAYKKTIAGGQDAFLVRMNNPGSAIDYATYLGGTDDDQGLGVAVDENLAAYVTGSTKSQDFPLINPLTDPISSLPLTLNGSQDAFIAKFTTDGSALIFSAYLGGSDIDQGNAIAVDPTNKGNMYVAGNTSSPDLNALNPLTYSPSAPLCGILSTQNPCGMNGDSFLAMVLGSSLPRVTVTPGSLNFTDQDLNTPSSPQAIQYTNTNGISAVDIQTISFSGSSFTQYFPPIVSLANCTQGAIAPSTACNIWVVFNPTAVGTVQGTLTITDDASSTPHVINLSGQTAVPSDILSATSLAFTNLLPPLPILPSQGIGNKSASQSVTLTNSGLGTLYINGIVASGDFTQADDCGTQVPAKGSCKINVAFTPSAVGKRAGSVTITDNASGSPHVIALTGTGALVISNISPTVPLIFPQQAMNVQSVPQTITVTNTDLTQALSVGSVTITGDYLFSDNCAYPALPFLATAVPPSCTIQVVFDPTLPGIRTGSLTISGNGSIMPATITLTGTAGATTKLTPTVSFPATNLGTSSPAQSAILANSSAFPFNVISVGISGLAAGDFSQTNNCGTSVSALSSCAIFVTFKPSATGNRNATITVTTDAAISVQSVAAVGIGTAPAVTLELSPGVPATNLNFPAQALKTASTSLPITLTNSGTGPLNIPAGGMTITGTAAADFTQSSNCGTQVAPKASCTINVVFTPSVLFSRSATLNIADDAVPNPQAVALLGTGVPVGTGGATGSGTIQLAPAILAFGNQQVNTTSSLKTVTLTNSSATAPLLITAITLSGSNAVDFTGGYNCPISPASLAGGGVCQIEVAFIPSTTAPESATISVTSTSNSPQSVALTGTGIAGTGTGSGAGTGTGVDNFTMTPDGTGVAIMQGNSAVYNLSITPLSGFKDKLTFTCAGPAGSSCSISPTALQMDGSTVSVVKWTVSTSGGNGTSAELLPSGFTSKSIFLAVLPFSMMGMLLITKRRGYWLALMLLALCVAVGMVGCGGNTSISSQSGALAPGSYPVTLTATSNGTTSVSQTISLNLVVNKK